MTRAALRDASFLRRPSTHGARTYHIVGKPGWSTCGLMLVEKSVEAADVPQQLRCSRLGCRSHWSDGVAVRDGQVIHPAGTDGRKP